MPGCYTGVLAAACTQGKRTQHGKPHGVVCDDRPDAREGQVGRPEGRDADGAGSKTGELCP
jgi:hypothetical protein